MSKRSAINCYGAYVLDVANGTVETCLAGTTLLASGGTGHVYLHTTNPDIATGDGIAMAYRAGAKVGNLEFMQFHPTSLMHPDANSFLISEAVRGYGGMLIDKAGNRIMDEHPLKDLAPRDVVARAIDRHLKSSGDDCVFLDVTGKDPDATRRDFPIFMPLVRIRHRHDERTPIPVVPAEHYMCGGKWRPIGRRT
jgi:L-aspartate oxidase